MLKDAMVSSAFKHSLFNEFVFFSELFQVEVLNRSDGEVEELFSSKHFN
jgi:hypothetical protein